jgi:chromosome segregation ATPase
MNDLHFENQLLQAEVAALRSELQESAEKHGSEAEKNKSLSRQLTDLQSVKVQARTLEEQNREMNQELSRLKTGQGEIEIFKIRIFHLENELNSLKETDVQAKIVQLNKVIARQDGIVEEFAQKINEAVEANANLKTEVEILTARLSSPYMRQYRAKWKIVSAGLAACLLMSMFTATWLFIR